MAGGILGYTGVQLYVHIILSLENMPFTHLPKKKKKKWERENALLVENILFIVLEDNDCDGMSL